MQSTTTSASISPSHEPQEQNSSGIDDTARGLRPGSPGLADTIPGQRLAAQEFWVEIPSPSAAPAAWCYSDQRVYSPGEVVHLHVSSNISTVRIRIYRDGLTQETYNIAEDVAVSFQTIPDRAYEVGCSWPISSSWTIPKDAKSGGYVVEVSDGSIATPRLLGHHFFIIRADTHAPHTIALVAATSTWTAYNDFGGANHYFGVNAGRPRGRSPILSTLRPWARGQIWLPPGVPRIVNETRPTAPGPARYEFVESAYMNGYNKYYASAGWATFERPFCVWAERNGYDIDILTQDELHENPAALDSYKCVVFIGHDEYWSLKMRHTVDGYVERGGNVARFAGNFMWQIRLENNCQRQVAYKYDARETDPVAGTEQAATLTGTWEDPEIGYPGACTFGVNALRGIYAGFGGMARRAPRGFTLFRPGHWAFERTGLGYADMFGDEANIYGFEMDGLEYTFTAGLPEPTFEDGAPPGLEILAMGWATLAESGRPEESDSLMLGDADARFRTSVLAPDISDKSVERHSRGSGMIVSFKRGAGEVFTAGTCEWVNGLRLGEYYTEAITKNVLERFLR
ncbi:hypothetical protein LTR96_002908 [Exophiala xenobiotica]|nr:hypothetical protein LTR96_002908 [Exophiala xenobiotica]KAK5341050.1 hypothetical protein LTR98_001842 [Exophiala xenobiotica]KAK5559112.1 hypothetical protein LTR46_003301 [Exophiala xenobiotica]